MKRFLAALFILSSSAFAEPSEEAIAAAEELSKVMGVKEEMKSGFDAMLPLIDQQAKQLGLSAAQTAELRGIYKAWFENDFDHEALARKSTLLYAEHFTVEELKELAEFYKSPLGKKTIEVLPKLTQEGVKMGMEEAQSKQLQLQKRLQPFIEKISKP